VTVRKTGSRRASTDPVPGSDPTPQASRADAPVRASEDTDESWGDRPRTPEGPNDARLKQDVPPHWG